MSATPEAGSEQNRAFAITAMAKANEGDELRAAGKHCRLEVMRLHLQGDRGGRTYAKNRHGVQNI